MHALKRRIGDSIGRQESDVHLFHSGKEALAAYLGWLRKEHGISKVAMPAFCCPEVCAAVLNAGAKPVFLDFDSNWQLSKKSIEYARSRNCGAVIWPNLFGARHRPAERLKDIKDQGLVLIADEAQSFPLPDGVVTLGNVALLFSFGPTKRLAGIGGGAVCAAPGEEDFSAYVVKLATRRARSETIGKQVDQALLCRLRWRNNWLAEKLGVLPKLERNLSSLLERSEHIKAHFSLEGLSDQQARIAVLNWLLMDEVSDIHREAYSHIASVIRSSLGNSAIQPLEGIAHHPSVLALRVPGPLRYAISKEFARRGIQTTWYYYPLNRISPWLQYESESTPNCDSFASEILVLPFQWTHTRLGLQISDKVFGGIGAFLSKRLIQMTGTNEFA